MERTSMLGPTAQYKQTFSKAVGLLRHGFSHARIV
jgi:hypothetical protein